MARWRTWLAGLAGVVTVVSSWPGGANAAALGGDRIDAVSVQQSAQGWSDGRGDLTPNQLTAGRALTGAEALAACGPAAAVAFARATGRTLTLDAALAAAREVGWTAKRGMAGPNSELALLKRLGISARLEAGLDRRKIAGDVAAGRPVIIRTGGGDRGHYLVAERYDAANGKFDFGQSVLVLRLAAGRRWFTLNELPALGMGSPTHAIYLAATQSADAAGTTTRLSAMSLGTSTPVTAGRSVASGGGDGSSRLVDAGGSGARLRTAPSTEAATVGLVMDGSRLTDLGATATVAGRTWRRVSDPAGTTAWIADELLRPAGAR